MNPILINGTADDDDGPLCVQLGLMSTVNNNPTDSHLVLPKLN